jgi:hypothetical protein
MGDDITVPRIEMLVIQREAKRGSKVRFTDPQKLVKYIKGGHIATIYELTS